MVSGGLSTNNLWETTTFQFNNHFDFRFHEREDSILYASCFDANAGLFEQLCGPEVKYIHNICVISAMLKDFCSSIFLILNMSYSSIHFIVSG